RVTVRRDIGITPCVDWSACFGDRQGAGRAGFNEGQRSDARAPTGARAAVGAADDNGRVALCVFLLRLRQGQVWKALPGSEAFAGCRFPTVYVGEAERHFVVRFDLFEREGGAEALVKAAHVFGLLRRQGLRGLGFLLRHGIRARTRTSSS